MHTFFIASRAGQPATFVVDATQIAYLNGQPPTFESTPDSRHRPRPSLNPTDGAGRTLVAEVSTAFDDLLAMHARADEIAREIDVGPLNQIILETGRGKLIIAPHGDLNVCVFTEPDANLGLIRVAIRGMQVGKD